MAKLNIKKPAALICAAAMMSSLAACGQNTTWAADIDGVQIPAGIFINYLNDAYYDAQNQVPANEDGTVDLSSATIEGKSAKDWMYDTATKSMQEYAAVESKFDSYGLTLTDDEKESVKVYCAQLWDYAGEYYEEMGISEKSFNSLQMNTVKRDKLFGYIYTTDGERAVSDDEIKAYLDENYALVNFIDMELKDGEGNLLKSEGIAERRAMAEEYIERYKNGEDFDKLNAEYKAFYTKLQEEAAAAADEDGLTAEVTPSDAEAGLAGEGDTIEDGAETEEAPEDTAETEEAPAETTAPEAEEPAVSEAETEETPEETETSAASEDADSADVESNLQLIAKAETIPSEDVVKAVFETMDKGSIEIIESADGEHLYIVAKLDVLETDEYFLSAKESLLREMKLDEFDELVAEWTTQQNIMRNGDAYKRYDPEVIFKNN